MRLLLSVALTHSTTLFCLAAAQAAPETAPPAGLRQHASHHHALRNARLVVAPGNVIERGTLVIRDGRIVAVGADSPVPAEARVWELEGKTVYAGFIDAYGEAPAAQAIEGGAGYWNPQVRPQTRVYEKYANDADRNKMLREQGIAVRLVAPSAGLVKGVSALVLTGDQPARQSILLPESAWHLAITLSGRGDRDDYPGSPMGALTLVRQALYDGAWHRDAWAAFDKDRALPRPELNAALAELTRLRGAALPVIVDAPDELYVLRADLLAREFELPVIIRGSGKEYRRLEAVKQANRPLILPLDFPPPPDLSSPDEALNVSLARLMHWDHAPENAARLQAAGLPIAFTSHGLADASKFLAQVRRCVERGLPPDAALAALTTTPAALFHQEQTLGSLAPGKIANFIVTDGDLFESATKILETWVDGRRHEHQPQPLADVRGTWQVVLSRSDGGSETLTLVLQGTPRSLEGVIRRADKEAKFSQVALDGGQLIGVLDGEAWSTPGRIRLSATALRQEPAPAADPAAQAVSGWTLSGYLIWPDGSRVQLSGIRTAAFVPRSPDEPSQPAPATPPAGGEAAAAAPAATDPAAAAATPVAPAEPKPPVRALYPVTFPLGPFGVAAPPEQPVAAVFRHATVWTGAAEGALEDVSVLIQAGKIVAIGKEIPVPPGAVEVDATGKHIAPGIVDCHSHIATDGGVNEPGQTITAEVRIGDFIDPDDINIYRQLAGGVTCVNILHGSANTIGGQNQVIKLRWGALPEDMKFAGAPPGIKFALGENVKQSNWGERYTSRYPQTRMGVEQLIRDAFRSARDYRRDWDRWNAEQTGSPPRRDLELEALSEVVEGKRFVHCHSYRQDEILALLRACEEFGVRVRTLQHVLEGYKVADALARHGVGGSSFADWWAYKFEVYDAIPYNGALMHRAGVVVSFNSDDAELARHLNLEAAKAIKYGGLTPQEALQFVTLNPARQLGLDDRIGSLTPGKDADFALWSAPPLSSFAVCEQTWVDGRKYFDRQEDQQKRQAADKMRAALVQRALTSGEPPGDAPADPRDAWARSDEFCAHAEHSPREDQQ